MKFKKLKKNAKVPSYGSAFAAGADLYACTVEDVYIAPGETLMIGTGIAVEIPKGCVGLVFARSGLSCRQGLAPANKVGVIDSDYRGEVMVGLYNHSKAVQKVSQYERIAQMVLVPYIKATFEEADTLEETERGTGGFGSTGKL